MLPSFDGADGVVVQDHRDVFDLDPPPRLRESEASQRFLDRAATPPVQACPGGAMSRESVISQLAFTHRKRLRNF